MIQQTEIIKLATLKGACEEGLIDAQNAMNLKGRLKLEIT
jgi:hypothetical protein